MPEQLWVSRDEVVWYDEVPHGRRYVRADLYEALLALADETGGYENLTEQAMEKIEALEAERHKWREKWFWEQRAKPEGHHEQ